MSRNGATELRIEVYDDSSSADCALWIGYNSDYSVGRMSMDFAAYVHGLGLELGPSATEALRSCACYSLRVLEERGRASLRDNQKYRFLDSARRTNARTVFGVRFFDEQMPHISFEGQRDVRSAQMSVVTFLGEIALMTDYSDTADLVRTIRVFLGLADRSSVSGDKSTQDAAQRAAQYFAGNDGIVWFMLPMLMDLERPEHWVFGPLDRAINVFWNHQYLGAGDSLDNGMPIAVPVASTEWTQPTNRPRLSGPYGPRYLPDHPNPSMLGSLKHSCFADWALDHYLKAARMIVERAGEITLDTVARLDLSNYMYGSMDLYDHYVGWLIENHPEYYTDPGLRIDAHYGIVEFVTFDDVREAEQWLRAGVRLFAVSRDDVTRLRSLLALDYQKVRTVLGDSLHEVSRLT